MSSKSHGSSKSSSSISESESSSSSISSSGSSSSSDSSSSGSSSSVDSSSGSLSSSGSVSDGSSSSGSSSSDLSSQFLSSASASYRSRSSSDSGSSGSQSSDSNSSNPSRSDYPSDGSQSNDNSYDLAPCDGVIGLYNTGEHTAAGTGCDDDLAWGAKVTTPNGAWFGGGWISTVCNNSAGPYPAGDASYNFDTTFSIAGGVDLSRIAIAVAFSVDNHLTEVLCNGNACDIPTPNGFASSYTFTIPGAFLVHGTNNVRFTVYNAFTDDPPDDNPMGLRVVWECVVVDGSSSSSSSFLSSSSSGVVIDTVQCGCCPPVPRVIHVNWTYTIPGGPSRSYDVDVYYIADSDCAWVGDVTGTFLPDGAGGEYETYGLVLMLNCGETPGWEETLGSYTDYFATGCELPKTIETDYDGVAVTITIG